MARLIAILPFPNRARARFLWSALLVGSILSLPANAQTLRDNVWITNGEVRDIAYGNNVIYLGGSFTKVGPASGSSVAIDIATATAVQPFPKVFGSVYAVEPDGSGGWYLGGSFTHVRGEPRVNLAHIDGSGNLTNWKPSAGAAVWALARSGTRVYIGGDFIALGGQPRKRVAAVDATTGALSSWNPGIDGSTVRDLLVSGGTVYVAGAFTKAGGQPRANLAAIDAATGSVTSFTANASSTVHAIGLSGTTMYAGGAFTTIGVENRNYLAALDAGTGVVNAWNPGANGVVFAVAVVPSTSTVYVAGGFNTLGASGRSCIGAVHSSTGAVLAFDPNADFAVRSLATFPDGLGGTTVVAGGDFSNIGGQERSCLAQLDGDDGVANAWNPGVDADVYSVAVSGAQVLAGGLFTMVHSETRNGLAALDATSGEATDWDPNVTGMARTLLLSGSTLYVGGNFTAVGGQPRNLLAAVNTHTGQPTSWDPNGGSSGSVHVLTLSGGVMYVGGQFGSMGGVARSNLAAVDPATGALQPFQPNVNGTVSTVKVVIPSSPLVHPTVYIGGFFNQVGGLPRVGIASIDAVTSAPTSWNPGTDGYVADLIVFANFQGVVSRIYAAGWFSSIGGEFRSNIAELNGSGVPTSWAPYMDGAVLTMLLSGTSMFVGGDFGGAVAEIDLTTAEVTGWNAAIAAPGYVSALLKQGGTVYAGGSFLGALGYPQHNFVGMSDGIVTTVSPEVSSAPASAVRATPNPFRTHSRVSFSVGEAGPVDVAVYDVSGRLVRQIHRGLLAGGEQTFDWDGLSEAGTAVGSGVYFVRVISGSRTLSAKLLRLR